MKLKLVLGVVLLIPNILSAEDFSHCNSLIQHGITNITRYKSADHAIAYKWHSNCGVDFSSASDSTIRKASVSVFGYGSGDASGNSGHQSKKLKKWCDENKSFAQNNKQLYEEARTISDSALQAWNQCQTIAKKGVFISANPSGNNSDFVHFEIDSTLDADLRLFPETSHNYTCTTHLSEKEGDEKGLTKETDLSEQPLIRNSNVHISCSRQAPKVDQIDGFKRLIYEQAYISVQTSGPSLQFYAPEVVQDYLSTPAKSVVAFAASKCPNGWNEFKPAQGRFIRGIDKTGNNIDPDGTRLLRDLQDDSTKIPNNIQITNDGNHSHPITQIRGAFISGNQRKAGQEWSTPGMFGGHHPVTDNSGSHSHGVSGGAAETRPKNVALLYCEKI